MLTVAARRVRATLLAADAGSLPFRDGAFDVTIAVTVCEFTASPAALVAELARVTRPGTGRDRRAEPPQRLGTGPAPPAAPAALAGRPGSSPAASCVSSARATAR
jgi:ubiquinone/menaquinone biosynthesis C-methylase UbiE